MNTFLRLGIIVFLCTLTLIDMKRAMAQIPVQSSDGNVLGIVATIDQNEIQAAQVAEQKNIDRRILDYARMLDREHNRNLDMARRLAKKLGITLVENSTVLGELRTNGEQVLAALSPLDNEKFEHEFIGDVLKGHADVLTWIDSQTTQNPEIKKFLEQTRKHVAMHLKKARSLQALLP